MELKIGDRVRMLRSSEEGVVVKVSGSVVEFETTDGFVLPVMATDLVKVAVEEKEFFRPSAVKTEKEEFIQSLTEKFQEAISLGFEAVNDDILRPFFINHFKTDVFFVISVKKGGEYTNWAAGQCAKNSEVRIFQELKKSEFEKWSKLQIQILNFKENENAQPGKQANFQLKTARFFNEKKLFGPNRRNGYEHFIDFSAKTQTAELKSNEPVYFEPYRGDKAKTLDLHAASLGIKSTNAEEILNEQLKHFLTQFDLGVANDLSEMTVIHGVGNGVLRNKIHQHLAKSEHVESFKDEQKEKFGYGATLIHYKP